MMIRISNGPIKITTYSEDRWSILRWHWSVNPWGWTTLERFEDLRFFESKPNNLELLLTKIDDSLPNKEEQQLSVALKNRMEKLKSYHQVYQFNTHAPNFDGYIRMCAVLCGEGEMYGIQYVNWFDAYIKYNVYKAICNVANSLINLRRLVKKSLN